MNTCKSEPSFDHKLALSIPIFSNIFEYMMSHELPPSTGIRDTSIFQTVVVITRGKIKFGMSLTFLKSRNSIIDRSRVFVDVLPAFLWTTSILTIFLFIDPCDRGDIWAFIFAGLIYLTIGSCFSRFRGGLSLV